MKTAVKAQENFVPNLVFNHVMEKFDLKNDVALSKKIGISTPTISKIRSGTQKMSDGILMKIYEGGGIEVAELRALMKSK